MDGPIGGAEGYTIIPNAMLGEPGLTSPQVHVYLAVRRHCGEDPGGCCFASAETIGKLVGKKERVTRMILDALVAKGHLVERPDSSRATGRVFEIPDHRHLATLTRQKIAGLAEVDPAKNCRPARQKIADNSEPMIQNQIDRSSSASNPPDLPKPEDPDTAKAVALARTLFTDDASIEGRVRKLTDRHEPGHVALALAEAERGLRKGAEIRWGYVVKILANWKADGGPTPRARPRPPIEIPVVTPTPESLATFALRNQTMRNRAKDRPQRLTIAERMAEQAAARNAFVDETFGPGGAHGPPAA